MFCLSTRGISYHEDVKTCPYCGSGSDGDNCGRGHERDGGNSNGGNIVDVFVVVGGGSGNNSGA